MLKRATISIKYTKTQIRKLEEIFKKYLEIDLNKLIEEEIKNIEDYNILYKSLNVKVSIPKESIIIANILSKYKNELIKKDKKLEKTLNKLFTIDNLEQKIIEEINKKRPKEELENELENKKEKYEKLLREIDKKIVFTTFPEILKKYRNKSFFEIYNTIKEKIHSKNKKVSEQEIIFYRVISNRIKLLVFLLEEFDIDFKEYNSEEKRKKALEILSYHFDKLIEQEHKSSQKYIQIIDEDKRYPSFLKRIRKEPLYHTTNIDLAYIYYKNSGKSEIEIEKKLKKIEEKNEAIRGEYIEYLKRYYKFFNSKFSNFIEKNKRKFPDTKFTGGITFKGYFSYEPEDFYDESEDLKIEIPGLEFSTNGNQILEKNYKKIRTTRNIPKEWGITGNGTIDFLVSNLLGIKQLKRQLNNNQEVKKLYKEIEKLKKTIENYKINKFSEKIINDIKTIYENKKANEINFIFEV